MNDRDCKKCVHHTSGRCSAWECTGTVTVKDVKTVVTDLLISKMKSHDSYDPKSHTEFEHGYHRAVEHMIYEVEKMRKGW